MLLTLLALAAPLPAMALNSDGSEPVTATPAPAALSVSTSLDSCGIVNAQVVCKLNVSFNPVEGADTYSATVTRADGSVVDYGGVGIGGASLWVPYVGPGGYSVRISAYGTPPTAEDDGGADKQPGGEQGNLITSDTDKAQPRTPEETGNASSDGIAGQRTSGDPAAEARDTDAPGNDPGAAAPPATTTPACETTAPAPPPPELPPLPEPAPPDLDPENPDEDGDGLLDADEKAAYEQALEDQRIAAMAQQGQMPQSVECPTG